MPEISDQELRLIALHAAIETEGPKAVAGEVIDAAQAIYEFLKGVAPAAAETQH